MEEVTQSSHGISRRTLIKGAAWSAPVIAVAVAAPLAAASATVVPNSTANYYWDAEAQGAFTSLVAASGGLRATFSTQISYRANPWMSPPAGGSLVVVVTFSSPVTLDPASSFGAWAPQPVGGSTATSFTFIRTPSSFGDALSFNVIGSAPGELRSTATMTLLNGGSATATTEPSAETAVLVA